ncbi:MAG: hypothetical protein MJZ20_02895 [Bacteroidaceae bacterium]|nr:hypothetical protein [Bacteroidaceae bacterium]
MQTYKVTAYTLDTRAMIYAVYTHELSDARRQAKKIYLDGFLFTIEEIIFQHPAKSMA